MVTEKEIKEVKKSIEDVDNKIREIERSLQEEEEGDNIESMIKRLAFARLNVKHEEALLKLNRVKAKIKEELETEALKAEILKYHRAGNEAERDAKLAELEGINQGLATSLRDRLGIAIIP